jgi:hypothetical protein
MKIGIVTFHRANNYGAVLQAFALSFKLSELFPADDIYIIDYCNDILKKRHSLFQAESLKQCISSLIQLPYFIKRKRNFDTFRKEHFKYINSNEVNLLDYLVCGSDQIWGKKITGGFDKHYFGIFDGFNGAALTYAASDGGSIDDEYSNEIKEYLDNLTCISVREKTMVPVLRKYYNKDIPVVLDPVFLYDRSFWHTIADKQLYRNYILVYRMENDQILNDAIKLASKTDKQIIEVCGGFPYREIFQYSYKKVIAVSIPKFISLFLYADCILTNSYHGMVLSIVFNKQFFAYKIKNNTTNRLRDLLAECNLTERYIENITMTDFLIDFDAVNSVILEKREESINFLKKAIKT